MATAAHASSRNACKHGLSAAFTVLAHEDQEDFEAKAIDGLEGAEPDPDDADRRIPAALFKTNPNALTATRHSPITRPYDLPGSQYGATGVR